MSSQLSHRQPNIPLVAKLLLAAMTAILALCFANQPWGGDDLFYGHAMTGLPAWRYPLVCGYHWLHANGRMANYLALALMYYTPTWLIAVANALVTGGFFWMILTLCRRGRKSAVMSVCVIALVLWGFCWWDSFFLFDVSLNYTWAATFGMIWAWWLIAGRSANNKLSSFLAIAFAFVAGCMHEAMSLPLLAGVTVWLLVGRRWKSLTPQQRRLVVAFAVGALCVIGSPGIWGRLGAGHEPDDPIPMLLLKSDWMALAMIVIFGALLVVRESRRRLIESPKTDDLSIWVVAAIGSMMFSAVGGIVGRSGWFANTFALIAVVRVLYTYINIRRVAAGMIVAVVVALCLFHLEEYARWQIVTGRETHEVNELYAANPTAPVFYDYTYLDEVPWWVLNKLRLVPDPDNFHELRAMQRYLGDGESPVVVLPTEVQTLDFDELNHRERVAVRHGEITLTPPDADERNIATLPDGRQFMLVSFMLPTYPDTLYYVTPRQLNPGDR